MFIVLSKGGYNVLVIIVNGIYKPQNPIRASCVAAKSNYWVLLLFI